MTDGSAMSQRDAFLANWTQHYGEVLSIRDAINGRTFPSRWMRIHSLPLSKRYPETKAEWAILLHRQNTLIDHLVPQGSDIWVVFNLIEKDHYLFKSFNLDPLGILQTAKGEPAYDSFIMADRWESGTLDSILMMIADETFRGFIMAPDCLIGPYDGGVDVILNDPHTCYALKRHFKDWISPRVDGL